MDYLPQFLKYYNIDLQPSNSDLIDIESARTVLYPGAHIATSNPYEHYHHGIVVDTNTPDISIIHLWGAHKNEGRVATTTLPIFLAGGVEKVGKRTRHLYLVNYEDDTPERRQATVEIANELLGKADEIVYNIAKLNCESFACFCRTNEWNSEQIERLKNILIENATEIYNKVKNADENNRKDIASVLQTFPMNPFNSSSEQELYDQLCAQYIRNT